MSTVKKSVKAPAAKPVNPATHQLPPLPPKDFLVSPAALQAERAGANRLAPILVKVKHLDRLAKCADKFSLPEAVMIDAMFFAFCDELEVQEFLPFPLTLKILLPGEH